MKQAEIDAIKARLAVVQVWRASDEVPGPEMLQASRHHTDDLAALLTYVEQLQGRVAGLQQELAEQERQQFLLVQENKDLHKQLAPKPHKAKCLDCGKTFFRPSNHFCIDGKFSLSRHFAKLEPVLPPAVPLVAGCAQCGATDEQMSQPGYRCLQNDLLCNSLGDFAAPTAERKEGGEQG